MGVETVDVACYKCAGEKVMFLFAWLATCLQINQMGLDFRTDNLEPNN